MNNYLVSDRLEKLEMSKSSIEGAGKFFQEEGKKGFHKDLVEIWEKYFFSAKHEKKRICYLNLANEVLQRCRMEKNIQFIDIYKRPLRLCFKLIGKEGSEEIKTNCEKLLTVWEDRKIYDK
jgi:hypothetical protein